MQRARACVVGIDYHPIYSNNDKKKLSESMYKIVVIFFNRIERLFAICISLIYLAYSSIDSVDTRLRVSAHQ